MYIDSKIIDKVEGWEISLNRNVYMYYHSLSVKKGDHKISISCEDLPTKDKTIGVWVYTLEESEEIKKELAEALLDWTKN